MEISIEKKAAIEAEIARFRDWLSASGNMSKKTIGARVRAYRAVLFQDPHLPARPDKERLLKAAEDLPDWQKPDVVALFRLLAMMEDDREELMASRSFSFVEFNPGLGSLGFGAERAGGQPLGAFSLSRYAEASYRLFQGEGSVEEPVPPDEIDLVLVNLPFTMFPDRDPVFTDLLDRAVSMYPGKPLLLRVDWTLAHRVKHTPDELLSHIRREHPYHHLQHLLTDTYPYVPMKGCELFIAVLPIIQEWSESFRMVAIDPVTVTADQVVTDELEQLSDIASNYLLPLAKDGVRFPQNIAERIQATYWHDARAALVSVEGGVRMLYPHEILRMFGLPGNISLPSHRDTAYRLLGECVPPPVAERAVRGLLRAIGG